MAMNNPQNDSRALVSIEQQHPSALIPGKSEWVLMREMAASLVPTGFLPKGIDTPEKAVAVMLKGRELSVPPMYALSNIAIVQGKPTVSAEMMLALIYRDHGKKAIRVKESTNERCVVEYRLDGWDDVSSYAFTIQDATKANLTKNPTWNAYPAAMLRARCISAVARMAFPECIAGMYVPGELGDDVSVTDDGEVMSVTATVDRDTGEIRETPAREPDRVTAEVVDEPAQGQMFNDTEEWEKANKRLHAVASGIGFGHDVLHIMATIKGKSSLKELPAEELEKMANFLDGDPERVDDFYTKFIEPRMPQDEPEAGA